MLEGWNDVSMEIIQTYMAIKRKIKDKNEKEKKLFILVYIYRYHRMSKVAHNLSRYLKLSVHLLHVIMFSGNILSVRDILHMQLEYLKHFFFIILL